MDFTKESIDKSRNMCYNIYIKAREDKSMTMKQIELATAAMKMKAQGKSDAEILAFLYNNDYEKADE